VDSIIRRENTSMVVRNPDIIHGYARAPRIIERNVSPPKVRGAIRFGAPQINTRKIGKHFGTYSTGEVAGLTIGGMSSGIPAALLVTAKERTKFFDNGENAKYNDLANIGALAGGARGIGLGYVVADAFVNRNMQGHAKRHGHKAIQANKMAKFDNKLVMGALVVGEAGIAGAAYGLGRAAGAKRKAAGKRNLKTMDKMSVKERVILGSRLSIAPIAGSLYRAGSISGYNDASKRVKKSWGTRKNKYGRKGSK
jgi:hypothetical protein